jgi:D-sedoheptulose 7-phosphate isomerase
MKNQQMLVLAHLEESIKTSQILLENLKSNLQLEDVCNLFLETYKSGKKVLVAGNGGSAADAQHFVGELVSSFYFERPPLRAIALTTDTSVLTAIGNDYGYDNIFARQISAHGDAGDIFLAITTSGNSNNILKAIAVCREMGITVVGLTGELGGKMRELCDYCICIPSRSTPRIQECHIIIEHIICAYVECALFSEDFN